MIQNPAIQGGGGEPEMVNVKIMPGASSIDGCVFCIVPANGDKTIAPVRSGTVTVPKNSTCVAFVDANNYYLDFPGSPEENREVLRHPGSVPACMIIRILGDLSISQGSY